MPNPEKRAQKCENFCVILDLFNIVQRPSPIRRKREKTFLLELTVLLEKLTL